MKAKFITLVLAVFVLSCGLVYGQEVILDDISGLRIDGADSTMPTGASITYTIRLTNGAEVMSGITNGFRVYSDNGATWTTTVADTIFAMKSMFDGIFAINTFSTDGAGADTIGFGGSKFFGTGMPASFSEQCYTITIGPLPTGAANHDKTICIDSAFYFPTGAWKWAPATGEVIPSWTGVKCFQTWDEGTDVVDNKNGLPNSFGLAQNYPNPFNPTTTISFDLPVKSDVELSIYNIAGQKVKDFSDTYDAGSHIVTWDAASFASGIYFYKIVAGDYSETKKMVLMK